MAYPDQEVTASQRKAKEFLNNSEYKVKGERPLSSVGNWKDITYQKTSNVDDK